MKETYDEAMTKVFEDEGGYTNDAEDPGGPTNWGITIADARLYWKPTATASDVRNMPKSVAEDIYRKHYAIPLHYDDLPAGVDYAVLDYGINSGIYRSAKVLQKLVGVPIDSQIGPATIDAVNKQDPKELINKIYDERLAFLRSLRTFSTFGRGWTRRCTEGRTLALQLADKYKKAPGAVVPLQSQAPAATATVATGTVGSVAVVQAVPHEHLWGAVGGVLALAFIVGFIVHWWRHRNVATG